MEQRGPTLESRGADVDLTSGTGTRVVLAPTFGGLMKHDYGQVDHLHHLKSFGAYEVVM